LSLVLQDCQTVLHSRYGYFFDNALGADAQRDGGFTQAGGSQKFGREIHFQICTNVSVGIHPRLRETAYRQCFLVFLL